MKAQYQFYSSQLQKHSGPAILNEVSEGMPIYISSGVKPFPFPPSPAQDKVSNGGFYTLYICIIPC